ncbi:hypothetical protein ACQ4PT_060897 [Festuca glaucescens]
MAAQHQQKENRAQTKSVREPESYVVEDRDRAERWLLWDSLEFCRPRIGELEHLNVLSLPGNKITGGIPEQFGNLSSLTSLDLEDNLLVGVIPASLGHLTKLQLLILSQNSLNGSIPDTLATISSLTDIRLAYNSLSGQIPAQLFEVARYNFSGNNLTCGANFVNPCASSTSYQGASRGSKIGIVLGTVGGVIGLLTIGALFIICNGRRKGHLREVFVDVSGEDDRRIAFGQLKRFAWRELQLATDNFSEKNVLGQGGFGKVYKGALPDGTKIAVKRLTDYESPGGEAAFLREVELISVAVHRNLLRLVGFCTTQTERLLVYPFMQNLSVAYRLREFKPEEPILDWNARKRVAIGTARGLEYLHEHCNPKIIHRDVKAANVLLDEGFEPVVGDFGLAKLVDVQKTSVTTQVRGTMGHIAPEYLSTGKSSERTDVFGYGIMLLEVVTGQRAIDFSRLEDEDDVLLLDHVRKLQREGRLDDIVDRNLNSNFDRQEVEMMMQIALLCTQGSPEGPPLHVRGGPDARRGRPCRAMGGVAAGRGDEEAGLRADAAAGLTGARTPSTTRTRLNCPPADSKIRLQGFTPHGSAACIAIMAFFVLKLAGVRIYIGVSRCCLPYIYIVCKDS